MPFRLSFCPFGLSPDLQAPPSRGLFIDAPCLGQWPLRTVRPDICAPFKAEGLFIDAFLSVLEIC